MGMANGEPERQYTFTRATKSQTDREFIMLPSRYPYHALYKKLTRQCKKVTMFGHHSGESHERIRQIPQHEDCEKTKAPVL